MACTSFPRLQYDLNQLAPQPPGIPALFPHQLAALHRMIQFESCHNRSYTCPETGGLVSVHSDFGVYLERSGAGKSYTLLGLFASHHVIDAKQHVIHSVSNESFNFSLARAPVERRFTDDDPLYRTSELNDTTLLVSKPGEHIRQWSDLLQVSQLPFVTVSTTAGCRSLLSGPNGVRIVVVTHTMLRTLRRLMISGFVADDGSVVRPYNVVWKRIVVDDAHRTMVPSDMRSGFTWFVTNTTADLHANRGLAGRIEGADALTTSIFRQHVTPEVIPYVTVTGADDNIDAAFSGSQLDFQHIVCKPPVSMSTSINISNAHANIDSGNHTALAQHLGIDTVPHDQVLARLVQPFRKVISSIGSVFDAQRDRSLLTESEVAYNKCVHHIHQRIAWLTNNVGDQADCLVCYDPLSTNIVLKCGHKFCPSCLFKWWFRNVNTTARAANVEKSIVCPMCKDTCSSCDMYLVDPAVHLHPPKQKLDTVVEIVQAHNPSQKVAIFGNIMECESLNTKLHNASIYAINAYTGKTPQSIVAFKPGSSAHYRRVLVGSTTHESYAGIDLSAVDTVILLTPDKETPTTIAHIMGCVRNCASNRPLTVYFMYSTLDSGVATLPPEALRVWTSA